MIVVVILQYQSCIGHIHKQITAWQTHCQKAVVFAGPFPEADIKLSSPPHPNRRAYMMYIADVLRKTKKDSDTIVVSSGVWPMASLDTIDLNHKVIVCSRGNSTELDFVFCSHSGRPGLINDLDKASTMSAIATIDLIKYNHRLKVLNNNGSETIENVFTHFSLKRNSRGSFAISDSPDSCQNRTCESCSEPSMCRLTGADCTHCKE